MRTIIAGSRGIRDERQLREALQACGWVPSVVLSGTAQGVDRMGERWAARNSIPCERFPADWKMYGKAAGYLRNLEMAYKADALIALWDGRSRGTKNMICEAQARGLKVYVRRVALDIFHR